MKNKTRITIVGAGYVGTSLSVLLAKKNDVSLLDVDAKKVKLIQERKTHIKEPQLRKLLKDKTLNISATTDYESSLKKSQFTIICTPTNFSEKKNHFDTSIVEDVIRQARKYNKSSLIVIKSTVPVGFTKIMQRKYRTNNIIFSPEFLREGSSIEDNLCPSRIIVGSKHAKARQFSKLLEEISLKKTKTFFMKSSEAEAVKLFSNTFLAMRVSFFNELDSYSMYKDFDSKSIISGISADPRIGNFYNNPSFGYGGYCLPKDTKQLLSNYDSVPQRLIKAIVNSNEVRKDFISEKIFESSAKVIGIFLLSMKANSDNFRFSSILGIIKRLKKSNKEIIIYDPTLKEKEFLGLKVINDLNLFKKKSDLILTNRKSTKLKDVKNKVFTRDIFQVD
ncbi:MAG: UDP-glucose 6-dehydrogenase [Pseudomonadota bacterium]|nr:MAG: UDP-glucose 6-dehydrogenase [Pseudomonadota bacterium]